MECYTSRNMRADLLFTRNQFDSRGGMGNPAREKTRVEHGENFADCLL